MPVHCQSQKESIYIGIGNVIQSRMQWGGYTTNAENAIKRCIIAKYRKTTARGATGYQRTFYRLLII